MNDQDFRLLLDRQVVLLDAVKAQGILAALRHKSEMERGARAVIAECYRRLDADAAAECDRPERNDSSGPKDGPDANGENS